MFVDKNLIDLLPHTSFVQFQAWRARNSTICWANNRIEKLPALSDYAVFIPLSSDSPDVITEDKKLFLAERYGGVGLGRNGGGVRCGYDGHFQIKGIGQNPLVGSHDNYFHSYGGAAISEAVLEALWGEVCEVALPFGGVRALGILKTGTQVPVKFPRSGKSKVTDRALIVREAALRPAHFLRAVFFATTQFPSSTDTSRVRNAIQQLDSALAMLYGDRHDLTEITSASSRVRLIESGLLEFCRRAAQQIAAARARRIMHGSLTSSNFAFSGQWLDFGSISAVSDYGRIIIPRGAPDFMHEEELVLPTLRDLVFYLNKYSGFAEHGFAFDVQPFWDTFRLVLAHRLRFEFLLLTGVTEDDLERIPAHPKDALYQCMVDIMSAGNSVPFTILVDDNDYQPVMPGVMGKYHLPTILREAALCKSADEFDSRLMSILPDIVLRQRFTSAYADLKNAMHSSVSENSLSARSNFICLNAIRRNLLAEELYRTVLYPKIDDLIENHGDIPSFIDERIKIAELLMAPEKQGRFVSDAWFGHGSLVDARFGVKVNGEWIGHRAAIAQMDSKLIGEELKRKMILYAA